MLFEFVEIRDDVFVGHLGEGPGCFSRGCYGARDLGESCRLCVGGVIVGVSIGVGIGVGVGSVGVSGVGVGVSACDLSLLGGFGTGGLFFNVGDFNSFVVGVNLGEREGGGGIAEGGERSDYKEEW